MLSIRVRARLADSVDELQWFHAFAKQSSSGWGLLGFVVVLKFTVVAVITPQYVSVEAGVGVRVGGCESDGGVLVATG